MNERKAHVTCTGIDLVNLYNFLQGNQKEGVIPLKMSSLLASAEAMLGREFSPSTVRKACKELKITYRKQAPAGTGPKKVRPSSAAKIRIATLENNVAVLIEKVEYLMRELGCRKEFEAVGVKLGTLDGRNV